MPALLALAVLALGCKPKEHKPARGATARLTSRATPPAMNVSPMKAAFSRVVEGCEVSLSGAITTQSCADPQAERLLVAAESQLGSNAALALYCKAVGARRHVARALASRRIWELAGSWRTAEKTANAAVYRCFAALLPRLTKPHLIRHAERIAAIVAWFGPLVGEGESALRLVAAHPNKSVRTTGYTAAWAHGRLGALPALEKVLAGGDDVAESVIAGFEQGPKLDDAERAKLCPLLAKHMTGAAPDICTSAAYRVGRLCGRAYHPALLAAARAAIGRHFFGWRLSYAVRDIARTKRPEQDASRLGEVLALLEQAIDNPKIRDYSRKSALEVLHRLDAKRGVARAKRYVNAGATLAATALELLAKKK